MRKGFLALALVMLTNNAISCDVHGVTGIVEENSMYIPVGSKSAGGLTEEQFNSIIDRVETIYNPIISGMGKNLNIERNWDDGTVNAYASQSGNNWKVAMFGGLARHETITADGFATVVCHELGHHIGGAPKKASWWSSSWASNEGQADYFGTSKCLRKFMESDDNAAILAKMDVPAHVTKMCNAKFQNISEVNVCQRGAMAGLSLANLFRSLRNMTEELKFTTPDASIVSKTNDNHPAPQCRLDTYFQGALCDVDAYTDVDQRDAKIGTCNRVDGYTDGARPLCWYKPKAI